MMRLVDLMSEALVLPEVYASARDEALHELVNHMVSNAPLPLDREVTFNRLLERERLASTAVGKGIAIPHAKLPNVKVALASVARSRKGVDFGSRDGAPTHLFLTILAPEGNAGLHLKVLARASRLLMNESFRAKVIESPDASAMWQALGEFDAALSG